MSNMIEKKNDLLYVRETMRQMIEIFTSDKYTDKEKRNMVGVANAINNSAKIIINTYLVEIAEQKLVKTDNILYIGSEEQND